MSSARMRFCRCVLAGLLLAASAPAAAQEQESVRVSQDHQLALTGLGLMAWGGVMFMGGAELAQGTGTPDAVAGYSLIGFSVLTLATAMLAENEAFRTRLPRSELRARAEGAGGLRLANVIFASFSAASAAIGTAMAVLDEIFSGAR